MEARSVPSLVVTTCSLLGVVRDSRLRWWVPWRGLPAFGVWLQAHCLLGLQLVGRLVPCRPAWLAFLEVNDGVVCTNG